MVFNVIQSGVIGVLSSSNCIGVMSIWKINLAWLTIKIQMFPGSCQKLEVSFSLFGSGID